MSEENIKVMIILINNIEIFQKFLEIIITNNRVEQFEIIFDSIENIIQNTRKFVKLIGIFLQKLIT